MNTHLANVRCPQSECHGRIAFEVWVTDDGEVHARTDEAATALRDDGLGGALAPAMRHPAHPWCHEHEVELDARGRRQVDRAATGDAPTPLRVQGVVRRN